MDLIYKQSLVEKILDCDYCNHCEHRKMRCANFCDEEGRVEEAIINLIEDATPVDAVDVVRCKDCIFYKVGDMALEKRYCYWARELYKGVYDIPMLAMDSNDYCSHGARKEASE